jgi:hypothetical protein
MMEAHQTKKYKKVIESLYKTFIIEYRRRKQE